MNLLSQIDSPADLKRLERQQLPLLAQELRDLITETVQMTGGHLGSSLGIVELTIALHYLYDFGTDRLIYDVGHQAYAHKLLTGRRDRFHTLRQKNGLSGFTNRFESPYDVYTMGHAGTATSAALGIVLGDELLASGDATAKRRDVVAVVGDASMGCGVAFEAMNHGGSLNRKMLVVLNDNRWSIAKTVGALSTYLNKIRTGTLYNQVKKKFHSLLQSMPLIGEKMDKTLEQMIKLVRTTVAPGHVFEELGFTYFGPVDGHDLEQLLDILQHVRTLDGLVMVHVLTEKGKGMPKLEEKADRYHGVSPKPKSDVEPAGKPKNPQLDPKSCVIEPAAEHPIGVEAPVILPVVERPKPKAWTAHFTDAVLAEARKNPRVAALTAAMPDGTGLTRFRDEFPDRFFDAGIAEQHTVAFASGLATAGMRPVVAIYSTFLQRAYDQVFQEVLAQRLPVVFVLDRAGIVGQDGCTHHGLYDIAYLGSMPDIVLMAPRDGEELHRMLELGLSLELPSAIRIPRGNAAALDLAEAERMPLELGRGEVVRQGADLAIIAYGHMVHTALEVSGLLAKRGIQAEVVNARFAKPLDLELIDAVCRRHQRVFTVEDHGVRMGFGSMVLTALAENGPLSARITPIGAPDAFHQHGSTSELLREVGLDAQGIYRRIIAQMPVGKAVPELK